MRTALVSDIHANLEALEVVLADIDARGVDRIISLGDVIGYGPDPCDCIDLVAERCEFSLLGNHDAACLYEPTNFNPYAAQASYWTRDQFEPRARASDRALHAVVARRQAYLHRMVIQHRLDGDPNYLLVHASPRKPITEYVFADDWQRPAKIGPIFEAMPGAYAFVGHTHVPGVFTAELDEPGRIAAGAIYDFEHASEIEGPFLLDAGSGERRYIVNPGSVGQPRDGDVRASYAILEHAPDTVPTIEFFRLEYPVQVTCGKIHGNPDLPDMLGDRLLRGE